MQINRQHVLSGVGKRIKHIRHQLNLTRPELAKQLEISNSAMGKLENGEFFPSLTVLHRFSEEQGVSMDWLIFARGPQYHPEALKIKGMETDLVSAQIALTELEQTHQNLEKKHAEMALELNGLREIGEMADLAPEIREVIAYMKKDKYFFYGLLGHLQKLLKTSVAD